MQRTHFLADWQKWPSAENGVISTNLVHTSGKHLDPSQGKQAVLTAISREAPLPRVFLHTRENVFQLRCGRLHENARYAAIRESSTFHPHEICYVQRHSVGQVIRIRLSSDNDTVKAMGLDPSW